jgi:hypothetical protein
VGELSTVEIETSVGGVSVTPLTPFHQARPLSPLYPATSRPTRPFSQLPLRPFAVFPASDGWYFFPSLYYGYNVVAATNITQSAISSTLVPNHAYPVMRMGSAGNIVLRNPWGIDGGQTASGSPTDGLITISWADFSRSMVAYWMC